MNVTKVLLVSSTAALSSAAVTQASTQEGWQIELTPYIWAAGVNADVALRGFEGDIDANFHDIIENTDMAFMGMAIVSYNRFVLYLDYDYLSMSADSNTKNGAVFPVGTKIEADLDTTIFTGGLGYRFDTFGEHSTLDVLIGVRQTTLEPTLKGGGFKVDAEPDVTDTLLMLRPSFQISENWRFNPTLSYGIDGDSDTTYELMPQFQYNMSDSFSLRIGYKKLYYDISSGSKGTNRYFKFDGDFSGPVLGVGWVFPARTKHVEPAPAPVVAAAPEKCTDTDNDGVCDNQDQCPNTPPGKRVGPQGCDCDFTLTTHFAFNSATLTAEDKAQLDKLANVISNPNLAFVSGVIEGHTDSLGSDAYNTRLSYRRAEAVKDYLQTKGVTLNNAVINGLGESQPIADNKTEEGRAQNRRVVIRRSDCGPVQ